MNKNELAKNDTPENSSMALNEAEMKNLGKQMENLRTNQQLKKDGKKPDPIQYDKNNK